MSKVAVASTDGIEINEHFGRAKQFYIFEVDEEGGFTFSEKRENLQNNAAVAGCHPSDDVLQLLTDVEAVLAVQIGPRTERALQRLNIFALSVTGPVEKALCTYGQRSKFIKTGVRVGVTRKTTDGEVK